ncbi:hypothetical protein [Rhizobium wenxiniae]
MSHPALLFEPVRDTCVVVLVEISLPTNVKIDELMEKGIVW